METTASVVIINWIIYSCNWPPSANPVTAFPSQVYCLHFLSLFMSLNRTFSILCETDMSPLWSKSHIPLTYWALWGQIATDRKETKQIKAEVG